MRGELSTGCWGVQFLAAPRTPVTLRLALRGQLKAELSQRTERKPRSLARINRITTKFCSKLSGHPLNCLDSFSNYCVYKTKGKFLLDRL